MKKKSFFPFWVCLSFLLLIVWSCNKEKLISANPIDKTIRSEMAAQKTVIETDSNFVSIQVAKTYAENANFSDKQQARMRTLSIQTGNAIKKVDQIITVKDKDKKAAYYIIKYQGGGFCILSADKRAPEVLAFSSDNKFDESKVSRGLNLWLYQTKVQIENIRRDTSGLFPFNYASFKIQPASGKLTTNSLKTNAVTYEYGGPLLYTKWSQGAGYNDNCPALACSSAGNGRAWTGCVATAIAQVMAFHQYPSTYNFTAMNNYYGTPETARLMADIGYNVGMDYSECDGSGVDGSAVTNAAFQNFGYSSPGSKNSFDPTDQSPSFYAVPVIKSEIDQGRPVIISGGRQGTTWLIFNTYLDGHEWVCDGYRIEHYSRIVCRPRPRGGCNEQIVTDQVNYFHMNWGWGGYADGFYEYGYFGPTLSGTDQGSQTLPGSYNYGNVLYYNIHP